MAPAGCAKIQEHAGITLIETLTLGDKPVSAKAVVYAVADHGTPQHEAVHAYCGQAFGRTGPLWYAEGMAEMGQYWRQGDSSVHCHPFVIKYIRANRPKPLSEILADDGVARPGRPSSMTGDSWQNYAWRWALCHLLANNPNYAARFRPLGLAYLTAGPGSFTDAYGSMLHEIDFEYRFFLRHLDDGYRVNLCSWDWKCKFNAPGGSAMTAHSWPITAGNRRALVAGDTKYNYSASGQWQTSKHGPLTSADGQPDGVGRLEGIVFKDFVLGEPFSLGAYGTFTAPSDGQLFLRCRDSWNELADNKGTITFKIKQSGQGLDLPRPSRTAEEPAEVASESKGAK